MNCSIRFEHLLTKVTFAAGVKTQATLVLISIIFPTEDNAKHSSKNINISNAVSKLSTERRVTMVGAKRQPTKKGPSPRQPSPTEIHMTRFWKQVVRNIVNKTICRSGVFRLHIWMSNNSGNPCLTHWGRDKMAAIFQTTFSNAFSWIKMYELRLRFHPILFQRAN